MLCRPPLLTLTVSACLLAGVAAHAAPPKALPAEERLEKSPRHHEWVEVTTASGQKIRLFVVFPEVDRPTPAVVVIHENRGLNAWARSVTDQLAEAGYVAVAPDMLSGKAPEGGGTDDFANADAARTAIYELSDEQVREALDATVKYARGLDATTEDVVVSGFCWGGGKAFDYAAENPSIKAAFVFYGTAPEAERLKQVEVPVYGFYGGNDFRITGQVPVVSKTMQEQSKKYDPVVYNGAGHGFLRSGEASDANPADREGRTKAWDRWLSILEEISGD
ncbi:dienelactone hydrolase family protein [Candidatus Laterigemmans baculatus]|uniref:dienelactone hydrolase family protein n=1 Tax=Candidatus Laterigemmans baculatus TaxID=2770505 RepID=UPI0013DD245F|nr:dienelactone hydrolase family protein [Candidatus Laterigemmans baculatus]